VTSLMLVLAYGLNPPVDVEQEIDSKWASMQKLCFEGFHRHAECSRLGSATIMCCKASRIACCLRLH